MEQFTAIFTAVLGLFQHKFTLYGFTISYWDVLVWCLIACIVISFIKGLLIGDKQICNCLVRLSAVYHSAGVWHPCGGLRRCTC